MTSNELKKPDVKIEKGTDTSEGLVLDSADDASNKGSNHDKGNQPKTSATVTHGFDYAGQEKDLGQILALRSERYSKKVAVSETVGLVM